MDTYRPLRKDAVSVRKLEDECLLYDEAKGRLHVVNAAAGSVWELCDGSHSLREMEAKIRDAYEIPPGTDLAADIHRTLDEFANLELLEPRSGEPA